MVYQFKHAGTRQNKKTACAVFCQMLELLNPKLEFAGVLGLSARGGPPSGREPRQASCFFKSNLWLL
jgi:hypothetical protein